MRRLLCRGAAAAAITVLLLGCGPGDHSTTVTTGTSQGGKPARLEFRVGEIAAVGDVKVEVTALMLTDHPALPQYGLVTRTGLALVEGETYCQAFVKIQNQGENAVRVDPLQFTLSLGGQTGIRDKARTGPPAHSVLHGASLDLILTYVVPVGSEPTLVYRPSWFNGSLVFTGSEKPPGVA